MDAANAVMLELRARALMLQHRSYQAPGPGNQAGEMEGSAADAAGGKTTDLQESASPAGSPDYVLDTTMV